MSPTMAIVHNNIDDRSSIGAIAAWDVRNALERGWDVTAICADLDPELAGSVRRRRLYVPPRLHLLQWSVARVTLRAALRGWRPDVLVVHQPQLAALADVWNVHYLSRAARDVRASRVAGWRAALADVQAAGVAALEDRYLHHLPARTRVLFCGDGLQQEFTARYGQHPNAQVVYNPAFGEYVDSAHDRHARAAMVGGHRGPVVGFLGGADPRKGGDLLVAALVGEPELFLVHAGPIALEDQALRGRARSLGQLDDVNVLLDVVDVLVVPSRFDPFPLVVAQAASRGVPVVVSDAVGSARLVERTAAGEVWRPPDALGAVVARVARGGRERHREGTRSLVAALAPDVLAGQRFAEFEHVLRSK